MKVPVKDLLPHMTPWEVFFFGMVLFLFLSLLIPSSLGMLNKARYQAEVIRQIEYASTIHLPE